MSSSTLSRRNFLIGVGAASLASLVPIESAGAVASFNCFGVPLLPAAGMIRFGYAAITWDGNDVRAIKDISELGFPGIQLRSNILKEFGERPAALRALLAENKLEMVALSSGGVGIVPNTEAD